MRLVYFPINAAWAFVIGERVEDFNPINLHGFSRFFPSREAAVEAAYYRGLKVDKRGRVTSTGKLPPAPNIIFTNRFKLNGLKGTPAKLAQPPTIACGDCFRWATQFAQDKPEAVVVHGYISPPHYSKPHIPHAWVEWNGYVYDWQRTVSNLDPLSIEDYRLSAHPRELKRYWPTQALALAVKTRHWGPW